MKFFIFDQSCLSILYDPVGYSILTMKSIVAIRHESKKEEPDVTTEKRLAVSGWGCGRGEPHGASNHNIRLWKDIFLISCKLVFALSYNFQHLETSIFVCCA